MKKYIILATITLFINMVSAQFYLSVNPDFSIQNTGNVQNTGNDIAEYSMNLNQDMKVMVWDGDNPGFYWSLEGTGGVINSGIMPIDTCSGGNIAVFNPDVVLSEGGAVALIVWEDNGNIYVCSKEFVNNQFQHKYGPFSFGPGINPNVDAAHRYKDIRCVVTWEFNNEIFAKACNIEGLDTSSTLIIKPSTGDPRYKKPDVALYLYEGQTDTFTVVSFAYAGEKPNGNWLFQVVQYYIDSLIDPTKGHLDTLKYPNRIPSPGPFQYILTVGYPRIAAPALPQDTFDFSMVVDVHYLDEDWNQIRGIWNFTAFNNNLFRHFYDTCINAYLPPPTFPTTHYVNYKPVITYCGDNIHVAWEYFDQPGEIWQDHWHIIKLSLDLDGTPTDDYSVVNYNLTSNYQKPSIAGRFSYFTHNLYTFYDMYAGEVNYKSSYCSNQYLRMSKPEPEFVFYPNPANSMVFCKIPRDDAPVSISLYDINGRLLKTIPYPVNEISLDLSDLCSGIYLVRVELPNNTKSFRICKQ